MTTTSMRRSVFLAHREDDGCDAKGDDSQHHHPNQQHEQFTWDWDDELQELRQRLGMLEQWRRRQQQQQLPPSRKKNRSMENIGLLHMQNEDDNVTLRDATAAGCVDEGNASQCTTTNNNDNSNNNIVVMDRFELPESTYSLLITENMCSIPFYAGIVASALSIMCLLLTLLDELQNKQPGNPLGVPAGLPPEVRMAQYLGIIIGVLMEEEIPLGLEIIGKGVEQEMSGSTTFSMKRIVFSSFLRLAVGYLFLLCLFLVVVQESTVLGIFFDVLALEFVENIDDVLFALFKRGFFGRKLRRATTDLPCIESSKSTTHALRKWTKRFIRFVYFLNTCLGIIYLTYLTVKQQQGSYRCTKILVAFGDETWENAYATTVENGIPEKRLLIYSHFNGIYEEDGTHDGRPRYVERNKERGGAYEHVVPAEIIYCHDIEAWVFRHENIHTSLEDDNENPCSWLVKSQTTESYDLIHVGKENHWFVWKGLIESNQKVSIECNGCRDNSDCNYNGECLGRECVCFEGYFGALCQFTKPCNVVRSEKDENTTLQLFRHTIDDNDQFVESYGRPMYVLRNMSGMPYSLLRLGFPENDYEDFEIEYPNATFASQEASVPPHKHHETHFFDDDDFFETNLKTRGSEFESLLKNYTFVLHYTGRRWYGDIFSPELNENLFIDGGEYHAFWDQAFSAIGVEDNTTFLISAPSFDGSPVGVDFFEARRRNIVFDDDVKDYDYDPFGVLIPLVEYSGNGFFHCNNA